jgi:catechol 1,2-dioxygenase
MDFRARIRSDEQGRYRFRAVVPTAYPVPHENPYGEILTALVMHNMRPSHLHLKVVAEGYKTLVTQLYPRDDPWVACDNQLAVKRSLVVVGAP